jgi:Tripartite tricarboxylate transporter TctB family
MHGVVPLPALGHPQKEEGLSKPMKAGSPKGRRDKMGGKSNDKRVMVNGAVIFDLLVLAFFFTFAMMSLDYNPVARSVPFTLGLVGGLMTFLQLLADAVPRVGAVLRFIHQEDVFEKEASLKDEEGRRQPAQVKEAKPLPKETKKRSEWRQVTRLVLWLVGFIILLDVTNYLVAVGPFIFFVTKVEARETWKKSILLSLSVSAGFFLLFDVLLQTQV